MIVSVPSSQIDCSPFALSAVQPVQPSIASEWQVGRKKPSEINAASNLSNLSNLFSYSFGKAERDRAEAQRAAPCAAWEATESKLVGQVGQVGRVNDSNALRDAKVGRGLEAGWTPQDGLQPIIASSSFHQGTLQGARPAGYADRKETRCTEIFRLARLENDLQRN